MKNNFFFEMIMLPLMFSLLSISSCERDTCNNIKTFSQLSALIANNSQQQCIIRVDYKTESNLPVSYFEQIAIGKRDIDYQGNSWQNDHNLLHNITVTDSSIMLMLNDLSTQTPAPTKWHFNLELPDRRNYMDCTHIGNDDNYFIDMYFDATINGQQVALSDFSWKEFFNKGGL